MLPPASIGKRNRGTVDVDVVAVEAGTTGVDGRAGWRGRPVCRHPARGRPADGEFFAREQSGGTLTASCRSAGFHRGLRKQGQRVSVVKPPAVAVRARLEPAAAAHPAGCRGSMYMLVRPP